MAALKDGRESHPARVPICHKSELSLPVSVFRVVFVVSLLIGLVENFFAVDPLP